MPGILRVLFNEPVIRFVVAAAEDVPLLRVAVSVRGPLLHVPRRIERPPWPDALQFAGLHGALPVEVALLQDVRVELVDPCRVQPVVDRRQTLAGERGERRRLEPTDPGNGVVGQAVREGTDFPGRGPGAARRIAEPAHRLVKSEHARTVAEGFFPVLRILVTPRVDELLVLRVGDFELIDPEVGQSCGSRHSGCVRRAGHEHHPWRNRRFGGQHDRRASKSWCGDLECLVSSKADAHAVVAQWHAVAVDRGLADREPAARPVAVILQFDQGAGRLRGETEGGPCLAYLPHFVGNVALQRACLVDGQQRLAAVLEPFDLAQPLGACLSRPPRLKGLPPAVRRHRDEQRRDGYEHGRATPWCLRRAGQLRVSGGKLGSHGHRRLISRRGILRQRTTDDGLDFRRHVRPHAADGHRLVAQDRGDQPDFGRPGEWPLAGEHFVEHGAEGEDVGPRIDGVPLRLFRGHVGHGAHDHARTRHHPADGDVRRGTLDQLCQAEVQHLRPPVGGDDNVGRLDVAVDDAVGVRRFKGRSDLHSVVERRGDRQSAARQHLVEREAVDQLHRDEGRARLVADLVDRDDIRVVQRRGRPRFQHEPPVSLLIAGRFRFEHLQRDRTPEPRVDGAVDNPHPAAADLTLDAVVRNVLDHGAWGL